MHPDQCAGVFYGCRLKATAEAEGKRWCHVHYPYKNSLPTTARLKQNVIDCAIGWYNNKDKDRMRELQAAITVLGKRYGK